MNPDPPDWFQELFGVPGRTDRRFAYPDFGQNYEPTIRRTSMGPVEYPMQDRFEDPIQWARDAQKWTGRAVDWFPLFGEGKGLLYDAPQQDTWTEKGITALLSTIPFYATLRHFDDALEAVRPFHPSVTARQLPAGRNLTEHTVFMTPRQHLDAAMSFPHTGPSPYKAANLVESGMNRVLLQVPEIHVSGMSFDQKLRFLQDHGVLSRGDVNDLALLLNETPRSQWPQEILDVFDDPAWPQIVVGHEGRHRAAVLEDMGRKLMPVRVRLMNMDPNHMSPWLIKEQGGRYIQPEPSDWQLIDNLTHPERFDEQAEVARQLQEKMGPPQYWEPDLHDKTKRYIDRFQAQMRGEQMPDMTTETVNRILSANDAYRAWPSTPPGAVPTWQHLVLGEGTVPFREYAERRLPEDLRRLEQRQIAEAESGTIDALIGFLDDIERKLRGGS